MAVGEDYYFSDTDDDDDVDRYVFLARQPAPARRHAEGDESDEGDEDETEDEREDEDGGRRRGKRPLREVPDSPPPPKKKARIGVITSPTAAQMPAIDTDPSASSPRGVRDRESGGSEEGVEEARERPDPRKGKKAKIKTKKPHSVCGKRKSSPVGEEVDDHQEPRRDAAAAKTSPSSAAGRFLCNLCDRGFDSHQALGGHVLGHQKKAKIAIAAAASLRSGNRKEEVAVVERDQEDANGVIGDHAEQKTSVAVAAPDTAGGDGNCPKKKEVDEVDDATYHEDVDRSVHKKKAKKKKKPSVVAEDHMGAHGDGNTGMSSSVFAASHEGVSNEHERKREKASSRNFHNGNEETAIGAGSHNDGDVKNKKAAIGASRKVAAIGNSNGDACKTQHKCKVCGTECATGWALGGHMRRHRKQPAHAAEGDGSSGTEVGDSLTPVSWQLGATGLHRALLIAGETSG